MCIRDRDGDDWTLVQRKSTNQRLSASLCDRSGSDVDALTLPSLNDSQLQTSGVSVTFEGTVDHCTVKENSVDQTDITSLIGTPFIIRSNLLNESKQDESKKETRKVGVDDLRQSPSDVRGLLRITGERKDEIDTTKEVKDKIALSLMSEADWPSISSHSTEEDQCESAAGDNKRDSKSWSTILRTVPLPQPIEMVVSTCTLYYTDFNVYVYIG